MRKKVKLNIDDLLHLKWAVKNIIELYGDEEENITNDALYQKLSYLYEEEEVSLQLETDPEKWKKAKACLDKIDSLSRQQHEALVEREKAMNEILEIHKMSFEEWKSNKKSF